MQEKLLGVINADFDAYIFYILHSSYTWRKKWE